MSYKIKIDLISEDINGKPMFHAKDNFKEKYLEGKEIADMMNKLHPDKKELDFVRKATKLFKADSMTIELKD